jgi:hypothetical protein
MSINYDKFFTYMAASSAFAPGATPEDVFTITGNATTNVYVTKMGLSTVQTTAGVNAWNLAKRSTANAGGTSANVVEVPLQSGNAAAGATVLQYTGSPATDGTLIGNLWSGYLTSVDVAAANAENGMIVIDFETMLGQPVALLSAAESLGWNFGNAATPAGLSILAWVQWSESSKT